MVFRELDVETHPRGEEMYTALGAPGVPVLLVDDEVIFGMNVRGWIDALSGPPPKEVRR